MRIIVNRLLPFGGFAAINLFGLLFVKKGVMVTPRLLNHERIHTRQMLELLIVGFYLAYCIEWLAKLIAYGFDNYRAYRAISFEREAYANEADMDYLNKRSRYAFIKYY